ncbi:hypothetical protein SteCoe_17826 [Stentor coeruleus]|uniref:Palmitoyltransferase n=1 Tax=Stentor coeruleus TaxID=5963 RepID=A0A1R2BYE7_9CILI|nr:hypothetical protein SteCoe_17826 [Stentor coeruleus]
MEGHSKIQIKKPSGFFQLGNTHCLAIQGKIYISIGPDWGYNLCLGTILLGVNIFFIFIMAPKVPIELQYIGLFIYLSAFISYLVLALKDPGIIFNFWEINLEEVQSGQRLCKGCSVIIEKGSEHCYDCQVCIRGYDHHCPISGKCIGSGNLISFYAFLMSVLCSVMYLAMWVFIRIKEIRS